MGCTELGLFWCCVQPEWLVDKLACTLLHQRLSSHRSMSGLKTRCQTHLLSVFKPACKNPPSQQGPTCHCQQCSIRVPGHTHTGTAVIRVHLQTHNTCRCIWRRGWEASQATESKQNEIMATQCQVDVDCPITTCDVHHAYGCPCHTLCGLSWCGACCLPRHPCLGTFCLP